MAEPQQPSFENMPLRTQFQIVQALCSFPAMTLTVFIRRKIGFRALKPSWLIAMTAVLIVVSTFSERASGPHPVVIPIFAFLMLGIGIFQRWRRWNELCSGVRWHTYCTGISCLELLPLPAFLKSHYRVERILDPILCAVVAVLVASFLSPALGAWISFSAICLHVHEQGIYERLINRDLDTLDGLIVAEVQMETVKHFEGPQADQKQRTLEETAGIPTGVAPDIHRQVELRRAKRAAAPDNMVKDAPENPA